MCDFKLKIMALELDFRVELHFKNTLNKKIKLIEKNRFRL